LNCRCRYRLKVVEAAAVVVLQRWARAERSESGALSGCLDLSVPGDGGNDQVRDR